MERAQLNEKCADCGHTRESHDHYKGCLCWINADANNKCLCKVWRSNERMGD